MLKVGIIGYGIMGGLHHQACVQHPGVEVAAVCNRSPGKLEEARAKGVRALYQDWCVMLREARPDAVIIALPDRLHAEVVNECLEAGCDVLVEKPMATTLAEARRMREMARRTGRKLMVNFSFRWEADFQHLKRALDAGDLGRARYLYVRVSDSIVVPLQWLSWAAQSSPSEFLLPHSIDLARWLTGQEIVRVYATKGEGVLKARGVDTHDFMVAVCDLSDGARLCLETSWILPESHPTVVDFVVEVQCEKGAARLDRKETGISLFKADKAESPITWLSTLASGKGIGFFYESVAHFLDWAAGKVERPISTADDGVAATAVLEAILASADQGRPITVCEIESAD